MPTVIPSPLQTQSRTQSRFIITPHPNQHTPARKFAKLLCAIFLSLLLAAAILLFLFLLVLRPHRPRFHLSSFSFSPSISFIVSIRNPNREIGIHYDSMSGSVFYRDREIAAFEGVVTMPFYQRPKNTTVVEDSAAAEVGVRVLEEIQGDLGAGRVALRLELRSRVRFRVMIWDTHRHKMHVSCNLEVGSQGNLLQGYRDKRCPVYFGIHLVVSIFIFTGSIVSLGAIISVKPLDDLGYKGWNGDEKGFYSPYASSTYVGWAIAAAIALLVTAVLLIVSWDDNDWKLSRGVYLFVIMGFLLLLGAISSVITIIKPWTVGVAFLLVILLVVLAIGDIHYWASNHFYLTRTQIFFVYFLVFLLALAAFLWHFLKVLTNL